LPKPRLPDGGQVFVILKKIILKISTICLWLFFQVFPRSKSGIFDSILNKITILGQPPGRVDPVSKVSSFPFQNFLQSSLNEMKRYLTPAKQGVMKIPEAHGRRKPFSQTHDLIGPQKIAGLVHGCKAKAPDLALRSG